MLQAAGRGDANASAELLPLVYDELRELARAQMAKTPPGNTLQPTALVNEAYVRLVGHDDANWDNRGHFFAAAARAMRQILVDQARRKNSLKRGGRRKRVDVDYVEPAIDPPSDEILALHEALEKLEQADPRQGEIVMLRYFTGLTIEETAAALGISTRTVEREWRFARSYLSSKLRELPLER
jgi:RNA polymerase sigma factor (TIGR02999 family)